MQVDVEPSGRHQRVVNVLLALKEELIEAIASRAAELIKPRRLAEVDAALPRPFADVAPEGK